MCQQLIVFLKTLPKSFHGTHGDCEMVPVELKWLFVVSIHEKTVNSAMSDCDSDHEWLNDLITCHGSKADSALAPPTSVVDLSEVVVSNEARTTLSIGVGVRQEHLQVVSSDEESLSDWAESWIHELCGRPCCLHIDHAADSDDREDRGQFGLQQDSQGLVTRQRTGALTAGLPSVEFVGALAIPMQPATSSATYGVCMPHVELAKFENFGAVAKYEGDCCRGQAVYAHEVPRQDSAIFVGTKDCYVSIQAMDLAMRCGGHLARGPFFDHAVSRLMMWKRLFGVIVFNIGIAAELTKRYHEPHFGYAKEGIWRFMDVVVHGPAIFCRHLEIELISAFKAIPGCYNEKPGGEGVSKDRTHPCFVYLVVADAGHGHALHVSCKRRRLVDASSGVS